MIYALFMHSAFEKDRPLLLRSASVNSKLEHYTFCQNKWRSLPENIRIFETEDLLPDANTTLICLTMDLQELAGHLAHVVEESELVNKVIASVI